MLTACLTNQQQTEKDVFLEESQTDKRRELRETELGSARERTEMVYLQSVGAGMSSQSSCILWGALEQEKKG